MVGAVVFDLDTLLDISALSKERRRARWDEMRSRLDEVAPYPKSRDSMPPIELVRRAHAGGARVGVVTDLPRPIARGLAERFQVSCNKLIDASQGFPVGPQPEALEEIRPPYTKQLRAFSELASKAGWLVASGFATGADTVAHQAAVATGGATALVMPSGLDIPFPPENRELWRQWQGRPGVAMISEFPLGTKVSALTLRKRNKTIVGVSKAVLVAQSSVEGGTMNAYRFALEQRKQVLSFPPDDNADSDGNRLIRGEESGQEDLLSQGALPRSEFEGWLAQSSR